MQKLETADPWKKTSPNSPKKKGLDTVALTPFLYARKKQHHCSNMDSMAFLHVYTDSYWSKGKH